MSETEIGTRVGVVLSADRETVYFLGFGQYDGTELVDIEFDGQQFETETPVIKLDNGQTVYGYECWWGSEDSIKEQYLNGTHQIVEVEITEVREQRKTVYKEEEINFN